MPTQPLYRFVLRQGLLELELACDDVDLIQRQLAEVYQQHFMAWLGQPSVAPTAPVAPQAMASQPPTPLQVETQQLPVLVQPHEIATSPPKADPEAENPIVIEITLPTPTAAQPEAVVVAETSEVTELAEEGNDDDLEAALLALEADITLDATTVTPPVASAVPLPLSVEATANPHLNDGLNVLFNVVPQAEPALNPPQQRQAAASQTKEMINEEDEDDDVLNALAHLDENTLDEPFDDTAPMPQEVARENQLHTTFANFEAMLEVCPPEAPRDHLLWAAYYLQHVEQSGAFTLQSLNGLLNEVGLPRAKHATLATLLDDALLEVKPDLTGTAEATDYSLTPQGVALMSQLLQQSVLA